ncbi:MAG: phage tail tape measure protein, partial [Cyanobacteria bacterium P01_H01_bin.121]
MVSDSLLRLRVRLQEQDLKSDAAKARQVLTSVLGSSAGSQAGGEFGDAFTKDAQGRLRDAKGRFVTAGSQAGQGFSDGFSRGLPDGQKLLDQLLGDVARGVGQGVGQRITSEVLATSSRVVDAGITQFVELDNALKQVRVISGATEEDLAALRQEVERLGIATSKAPSEIAEASVAFARAGFSAQQTTEALEGIVRASEATGESLQTVGDITAKTIRTFGLAASQSEAVANILVTTASSTNTTVNSIGESLAFVGAQAAAANQPVEDMAIVIGLLGDAGIQGSSAGTSLASALEALKQASAGVDSEFTNLVRGNAKRVEAFELIQTEVREADGSLKSILDILPVLRENLGSLSQQDQDVINKALFGVEGGRAIQTLLNTTDERLQVVTSSIRESQGAAIEAGEAMLTGLGGALQLLEGSAGATAAKLGEFSAIGLEPLVRGGTAVLNTFLALPAPLQKTLLAVTSFSVAIGAATVLYAAYNTAVAVQIRQEVAASAATIKSTVALKARQAATAAATAAQSVFAVATQSATAAQVAQAQALAATAAQIGALAGATVAVLAVADTFNKVTARAKETEQSVRDIRNALDELNRSQSQDTDLGLDSFTAQAKRNQEELEESLGGFQNALDKVRGVLPGIATAAEAEANRSKIQFNELQLAVADTRLEAVELIDALQSGANVDQDRIGQTAAALDLVISKLREQKPITEADIRLKDTQIEKLRELQSAIQSAGTATANGQSPQINIPDLDVAVPTIDPTTQEQALREAEQQYREFLQNLESANKDASNRIEVAQQERINSVNQALAQGVIAEQDAQAQIAQIEQGSAAERIQLIQDQIAETERLAETKVLKEEDANARILELNEGLAQANADRIALELEQEQQLRQAILDGLDAQLARAQEVAQVQQGALDIQLQSLSRQASLEQARFDLAQTLGSLEQERLNTAIALAEANGRSSQAEALRANLLELQAQQIEAEFDFKLRQLDIQAQQNTLEAERNAIAAQIAVTESEIALQKAITSDASAAEIANLEKLLDLNRQRAQSAQDLASFQDEQLQIAREQIEAEREIARERQKQAEIQAQERDADSGSASAASRSSTARSPLGGFSGGSSSQASPQRFGTNEERLVQEIGDLNSSFSGSISGL